MINNERTTKPKQTNCNVFSSFVILVVVIVAVVVVVLELLIIVGSEHRLSAMPMEYSSPTLVSG